MLWGIRDFEHRFGRYPEGMWLPETAVDLETLEMLADCGIRSRSSRPIRRGVRARRRGARLAGRQRRHRSIRRMPYRVKLPSGRRIAVFFYDGPISQAIAFEKSAGQGRELRRSATVARFPMIATLAATRPHRHGRRNVRPPSQTRRHGTGLRARTISKATASRN